MIRVFAIFIMIYVCGTPLFSCEPGEGMKISEKYLSNDVAKPRPQISQPVTSRYGFSKYGGWGYPRSVEVCNYEADCQPFVSGNGKRLFFISNNFNGPPRPGHQGQWDIYIAEWDSINQCWGEPINAGTNINTPAGERRPSSTYNGDTLYFGRGGNVWMSIWDGTQWTPATQLPPPVNPNANNPVLSFDGRRLYFDSDRPGGYGGSDIWVAKWNGTSWDSVTNVGQPVNTPFVETRPFESADGQRLYFSNFGGPPRAEGSWGNSDIYVSTWTGSGWGSVAVVDAPVNNDMSACTPYESPDAQNLWIGSDSWEGSRGDEDIWIATKGSLSPPDTTHGYGNWIKTGELENAIYVYDLKEGANGTIYAATACADTSPMGKVFKTTNGGASWIACADLPGAMVVYSLLVHGDTIYAGTYPNGDVFKSVDGGNAWFNTANLTGITAARCLLGLQDGSILVGTSPDSSHYMRVYRTTNGGLSWTRIGLLNRIIPPFKFLYQTSTGTIFAGGWGHGTVIYKSINNGVTWDTVRLLPVDQKTSVDGFYETSDGTLYAMGWIHVGSNACGGYVYKSVDSGVTWDTCAKIRRGDGVHAVRVYTIVEDSFGTIYAGFQPAYDSVVYASSDGGNSWYSTGGLDGAFECLTLLHASDGTIYAGTTPNGDVFKYPLPGVEEETEVKTFSLGDAYPNPFTQKTVIRVQGLGVGSQKSEPRIQIYDLAGKLVRSFSLIPNPQSPITSIVWDGKDNKGKHMPAGIYFIKLKAGKFSQINKLILLR